MVTIGRNATAAYLSGRALTGFPAWALWLGVHLFNLIGFRNRLLVLINWAWDYLFRERGVCLILPLESLPLSEAVECALRRPTSPHDESQPRDTQRERRNR